MKNLWFYQNITFYLTILLCLSASSSISFSLYGQTPQAVFVKQNGIQNDIPKSLERKFRRDAARLALRLEAEKEDLRYLNISIPPVSYTHLTLPTIYSV